MPLCPNIYLRPHLLHHKTEAGLSGARMRRKRQSISVPEDPDDSPTEDFHTVHSSPSLSRSFASQNFGKEIAEKSSN